jgi:hypothetical protein
VAEEEAGADGELLAGSGAGWQAEAAGPGEQGGVSEEEKEGSAHTHILSACLKQNFTRMIETFHPSSG